MTNQDWSQFLEQAFSKPRLARYAINPRKTAAATAYAHNMLLGQAIYPCLHVLEVSLRNAMHRALRIKYGRADALLWLDPDIRQRHLLCLEVIGWVSPELKPWLTRYDGFPEAWSNWVCCTALDC